MKSLCVHTLGVSAFLFVALLCNPVLKAQAQGRPISLPLQASEIAHGIYDLGFARDADGTIVQGLAFVHYKKDFARPGSPGGNKPPKSSFCYSFLASGAKWKALEPYVFDKSINGSMMDVAILEWESATGTGILGDGSQGTVYPDQLNKLNELNEVMFGNIDEQGVIAMTITWGVFGGPPAGRKLVEWDMVFDTDWIWGDADDADVVMDFLNIATHEIGHAMGMGHPSDMCTDETMYAYADIGETKKRDLNAGDIAGIRKLYP
jgi:hypothetical protein